MISLTPSSLYASVLVVYSARSQLSAFPYKVSFPASYPCQYFMTTFEKLNPEV